MFIYAEKLIEYAIRIGVDDIQEDPTLLDLMFFTDKQMNQGTDLTPNNQSKKVYESLPTDFFQRRLLEIPKRKSETGQIDIFKNSIPSIPDIKEYLSTATMNIIHGFPREARDLWKRRRSDRVCASSFWASFPIG